MARKKKLNTKFVIIGVAIVGCLVGGAVAWKVLPHYFPKLRWVLRGTPTQHFDKAKALYDEGKYEEAAGGYLEAMRLKGSGDALMYTALGDCYDHLALKDQENLRKARGCWDQALSIDPNYIPAMQRLLVVYRESAEATRGVTAAQYWDMLGTTASKVLALDPNDRKAQIAQYRAVLQRWVAGVETDNTRIDDAVAGLTALLDKEPFEPDVAFYILLAKINRGAERVKMNDRPGASVFFAEAMKTLDEILAAHPDNGPLHFRAATALRMLGSYERMTEQPKKYLDRIREELDKSAALMKPEDPDYTDTMVSIGRNLEFLSDSQAAEKMYRKMFERSPDDINARVALAQVLKASDATRSEAISLLENIPPPDPKKFYGVAAAMVKQTQASGLIILINAKLDALPTMTDKAQFDNEVGRIENDFGKVVAAGVSAEQPVMLQLRGRIQLAKGQALDAVQTLERALKLLPAETPSTSGIEIAQRYQIMYTMAQACFMTQQIGQAKDLLLQIVRRNDQFAQARLMLVQIYLRESNRAEAQAQLDALDKLMPDAPVIIRYRILASDKEKDQARMGELLAKLPEKTSEEAVEKAQLSVYCGRKQDAADLLERVHKERPDDMSLVVAMARLYVDLGDKPKAMTLVDDAIARHPERQDLRLVQADIAGADVATMRRDMVEKIEDPFQRELLLFEISSQEGRTEEMLQHLQAAAKLKPDDPRVLDPLFRAALVQKDWTHASEYAQKLAEKNTDMANGSVYRIRLALARGNVKEASDYAQQLTQKMAEFAQSWVLMGQVQRAQRKFGDSIQSFETALQKQSNNLDAIRGLILSSYDANQPAAARKYIDNGRRLFPNNPMLREFELDNELRFGDPEKVIPSRKEALAKAIETKDPAEPRMRLSLGNTYLAVARTKDTPQAARPFLDLARNTFKEAIAAHPDEITFTQYFSDISAELKDIPAGEKAIQDLRALPAWQGKPEPTILLANFYARAGKPADQEKVLREFMTTAPQTVPVQVQLTQLLARQNKLDEALKILEPNANDPMIRRHRIELQIAAGRLEDAEKEIAGVLASTADPSPVLLNRQAYLYMRSDRATQALAILDKVLAQDPGNVEAIFFRASIYTASRRNLEQAIQDLVLVRDSMNEMESRLILSDAYHYSGDDEAAMRELEDAVRLRPLEKTPRLRLLQYYARAVPPRWTQAERMLRDARGIPQLAGDVDLLLAEASMWSQRNDTTRAAEVLAAASKLAPDNQDIFRSQINVQFQAKQYRQLLAQTDAMVRAKKAPPWIYDYRGRAKKALSDSQGAQDELFAGFDVALANQDDSAAASLIQTVVNEIGVTAAQVRITPRAEKGDNRWRLMLSSLLQMDNDLTGAIKWAETVMNDSKATPQEIDGARRLAATFYLRQSPPEAAKAVDIYQKLLERDPNDLVSLNNLACTMILPGSGFTAQDALKYSQRAYDQLEYRRQVNPYIWDTQGYVLVLAGKVQEGINLLRQAIDKEPIVDACYHLGEAYMLLPTPQYADAEESLKQAQAILDSAKRDQKPIDADVKAKIEAALVKAQRGLASAAGAAGTPAATQPQ